MDVTCERCSTAYEFDDALVSERGTTVKCTNCGHQFKVRRPQPLGAPERWLVRTIDGRELEFRALRELQAAIAQSLITRDDVLSRGGSRPRRLGSIAELEPFFASAGAAGPSQATSLGLGPRAPIITGAGHDDPRSRARSSATPNASRIPGADPGRARPSSPQGSGLAPAPRTTEVSIAIPLPRGPDPEDEGALVDGARARRPASLPPPPHPKRSTPPGVIVEPGGAPPIPPPSAPVVDEDALYDDTTRAEPTRVNTRPVVDDVSAPTAPFQIGQLLDPVKVRALRDEWTSGSGNDGGPRPSRAQPPAPPPAAPPALIDDRAAVPPPPVGFAPSAEPEEEIPGQNQHTASVPPLTPAPAAVRHSYADDFAEPRFSQAPARRPGAARWIVGLVVVGMMALAAATVGRKMLVGGAPAKAGESDARIVTLLNDGEKSLADGDLESAKEQFDKASVLGERDPRAAADLARLAAARADVDWLRVSLLAPDDPELSTARRALEQAAARVRKAADRAAELAPTDPGVLRSRIDALRLAGDLGGARKLVAGISASSAQPDNALALAELDLAESKPDWPTVLGRLRTALATDGNLGRARSMLVYALARSGDRAGCKAEIDRLAALPRPHPLVGALRVYISHLTSSVDPNALPDASAKPGAAKPLPGEPLRPLGPSVHDPKEPREPRERPVAPEPREPKAPPEEHVVPGGAPIDTSDLPGVRAPTPPTPPSMPPAVPPPAPTAPAPPPKSTVPPGVDTSDLPGFK